MNILKYSLLWGLLICTMAARGQKIEILHEGEEPVWLSEQHQFVWDKVIPLHFKAGKAVYEVHHAPKVFRLATELGYSSWFFVGDKDHVTVTVLNTDPLNIKVEGDIAGTYFYELENVSREYTRGKLEMTSDYMKAWLDKDATLMREVNQQLERLEMNRDSAYMDVVNRMMEKGRLEEVLVKANMPLMLKRMIVQNLEKEGKFSGRLMEELDLYTKMYTPDYVYYFYYYPYVWREQINSLDSGEEKGGRLMNEVYRIMNQEFYNTVCNRLGEGMTREKLIDYAGSVSDFDYCIGLHMELDEQMKRDTALNKFSERMERMYMTRAGKVMGNFSSKTSEGRKVSLADYRGKYVLLDFWASWCGPCRGLLPTIKKLYEKYHATGKFDILGVSKDADRAKWLKALEEEGMAWNNILAKEASLEDPSQFESVTGLPQMVVVDPEGNIVLSVSGANNIDRVIKTLESVLGK